MIKGFIKRSFILSFIGVGLLSGLAGWLVLFLFGWMENTTELLVSWILSFILILSGYLANYWGFSKTHTAFLTVLFGGMIVRMLVFIGIVFWIYQTKQLEILFFLIFLAIYYFLFQTVEIFLIKLQFKSKAKED